MNNPADSISVSPPTRKTSKLLVGVLVAIPVLALGGGLAWWATASVDAAQKRALVDKHSVAKRSFRVSLKEKGELKAKDSKQVKNQVEGRSTLIWLIPEGTKVNEGDLLVELASDEIDQRIQQEELNEAAKQLAYDSAATELEIQLDQNASNIRKAELNIELKRLALDKYEQGDWVQAVKDAEREIERAKLTLDRNEKEKIDSDSLFEKGYITWTEHQLDIFNYENAKWDLQKAMLSQKVLEKYTRVADQRQRQSDLEEAIKECERTKKNAAAEEAKRRGAVDAREKELLLVRTQLAKLRKQKENCTLTAPSSGFVVYGDSGNSHRYYRGGDDQIREGATVYERQVLITLPDTSTMIATSRIHEAKTSKIQVGQPVAIEVEGLPGEQFTGSITKIAQLADTQNRWLNPDLKEYETEITLNEIHEGLKPGATAHCEIVVEELEDVVAIPTQCIYTKGWQQFVFQYVDGEIKPTPIRVGAKGTEWAEVLDGVGVGDQILLAASSEHRLLLPEVDMGQMPGMGMHPGAAQGAARPAKQSGNPGANAASHGKGNRRGPGSKKPHAKGDKAPKPPKPAKEAETKASTVTTPKQPEPAKAETKTKTNTKAQTAENEETT